MLLQINSEISFCYTKKYACTHCKEAIFSFLDKRNGFSTEIRTKWFSHQPPGG